MSLLFKELDEEETRNNVSKFLTKDLERLLLMSGHELTDLKSPQLSNAPGHSTGSNPIEDTIVRGINAGAIIQAIMDTIYHCPHDSKEILLGLYINKESWIKTQARLYCEHNKLAYTRRKALYDFADGFDHWQRVNHCSPIIDLHVYRD